MFKHSFVRFFKNFKDNLKKLTIDFIEDFQNICEYTFIIKPKHFGKFLVRLVQYLPILYRDTDWDYAAILKMLQYKLHRTRNYMSKYGHAENNAKICENIKEIEDLLTLIINDEYAEKECKDHDFKWGNPIYVSIPTENTHLSECRTIRLNVRTDKNTEQEHKEYRKIMNLEVKRSNIAWKKLWSKLEEHMTSFWD